MLFHQVFTKWYQEVHEVDSKAILYPWAATDHAENPMPLIENPTNTLISPLVLKQFA